MIPCDRLLLCSDLFGQQAVRSEQFCQVEDELLRLLPTEAGVCDGLAVRPLADLLVAVLDIALNHESLDERPDIRRDPTAVDDVFCNADLLEILLARVRMIGIDDDRRVCEIALVVRLVERAQVLIVVVRHAVAETVDIAAQDGMGQRIARRADLPATEQELLRVLCRLDRVEHDRDVARRRVLHADRDADAARDHAVELVFNRACADRRIRQQVRQIAVDFRIEDFLCTREARLAHDARIHLADRDDAAEHVFLALRVRLVQHALVTDADRARLARVEARHDEDLVLDLLLYRHETVHVIEHGLFIVSRARADDEQEAVVLARHDVRDGLIALHLDLLDAVIYRELLHELLRRRQPTDEFHLHFHIQ